VIRRATVSDHPWIVEVGAEAYRDLGDYTAILPSWLDQRGVLAWIDHDVSGRGRGFAMLGFYLDDPSLPAGKAKVVADLLALAILPAHQGKGIGTSLLTHVLEVAERVSVSSGIPSIRLSVAENNTGAQRLYLRHGFQIVDISTTYDRGQRALRMVRALGPAPSS
jgi:ribosomal protein S18 acetylase RimI-like enzyme